MARKKSTQEDETGLVAITEVQQSFIQALLSGKKIREAAILAGVSRRTATYWMINNNPVRLEYEKQRLAMKEQFYTRIANLHDLALRAMEDSLASNAPPMVRFNAAKYLYEAHLQPYSGVAWPGNAEDLADDEISDARHKMMFPSNDANVVHLMED